MSASSLRTPVLVAALLAAPALPAQNLQEGLWEVSVMMELAGQPASAQPMVMSQCIDQQTGQQLMAQLTGAGACNASDVRQEGETARWTLTCTGQVALDATGEARFAEAAFDGSMTGTLGMGDQKLPFSQRFTARRVGPCK